MLADVPFLFAFGFDAGTVDEQIQWPVTATVRDAQTLLSKVAFFFNSNPTNFDVWLPVTTDSVRFSDSPLPRAGLSSTLRETIRSCPPFSPPSRSNRARAA